MQADGSPCEAIRQHVFEYVDGAIPVEGATAGVIRSHVAQCASCARLVHHVARFRALLARVAQRVAARECAPLSLRSRVMALLSGRTIQ
jgi:anti-sigma factor RsiW